MADLATSCECRMKKKSKQQWISAGIDQENNNKTFSNFVLWNEHSRKAKETAVAYYKEFNSNGGKAKNCSILLCGQVSSGKSHLAIALGINFIKKNIQVVYMSYNENITQLKMHIREPEFYRNAMNKYKTCKLLLLDNLFKGSATNADINIINEIVEYRVSRQLPMIITTEFTLKELLCLNEGLASKINDMCKDFIVEIPKSSFNNYVSATHMASGKTERGQ